MRSPGSCAGSEVVPTGEIMPTRRIAIITLAVGALAACSGGVRPLDRSPETLAQGQALYQRNCARCHGRSAQGAPNWRQPDAAGRYPPPPLNGSGHTWHHPLAQLRAVIREGTMPRGNMPAWGGRLDDRQIDAIIAWLQSKWPRELFQAWERTDRRAQGGA